MAMIFQEPATALNPVLTVGHQIIEVVERHAPGTDARAKDVRRRKACQMRTQSRNRLQQRLVFRRAGGAGRQMVGDLPRPIRRQLSIDVGAQGLACRLAECRHIVRQCV